MGSSPAVVVKVVSSLSSSGSEPSLSALSNSLNFNAASEPSTKVRTWLRAAPMAVLGAPRPSRVVSRAPMLLSSMSSSLLSSVVVATLLVCSPALSSWVTSSVRLVSKIMAM
ncbi:hypothetical protein D3C81_2067140 [compost metagenome]